MHVASVGKSIKLKILYLNVNVTAKYGHYVISAYRDSVPPRSLNFCGQSGIQSLRVYVDVLGHISMKKLIISPLQGFVQNFPKVSQESLIFSCHAEAHLQAMLPPLKCNEAHSDLHTKLHQVDLLLYLKSKRGQGDTHHLVRVAACSRTLNR